MYVKEQLMSQLTLQRITGMIVCLLLLWGMIQTMLCQMLLLLYDVHQGSDVLLIITFQELVINDIRSNRGGM